MPYIKIYNKSRINPESAYLRQYSKNITTQHGEDGIREKIFEIMGIKNSWCVEFGAWDGKHLSTTWSLLNNNGWKGVLIEGDSMKFNELKNNYLGNDNVFLFNKFVDIKNNENSLDAILKLTHIPEDFDFLSIDIDGADWHIWNSLSNYRPRLVIIEFNPSIPNNVYFVQDKDIFISHGSSLLSMIELGKMKRYELVATTDINAFFVRMEDFSLFNISDNGINSMHSAEYYENILFQTYDGKMILTGCQQHIWTGIPVQQAEIILLPIAIPKSP